MKPERQALRVALPGTPNFVHLPGHLAKRHGLFKRRGLAVEIIRGESGYGCFGLVEAGEVDFAWTSTVGLLRAVAASEAEHLRMTVSPMPRLDIQILATPDIARCEDFSGQPVAVQRPGTFTHAMLDAFLSRCGLRIDRDVIQVESTPDDSGAVSFGDLLAQRRVVGCAGHADDIALIRYKHRPDTHILGNAWEFFPGFHYASYVMNLNTMKGRRDEAIEFIGAVREATAWLIDPQNRDEAEAAAAALTAQPGPVVRQSYEMFVDGDLFETDCAKGIPDGMLLTTAQSQVDLGIMDHIPSFGRVVDRTLCQESTF